MSLFLDFIIVVLHNYDVITRRTVLRNEDKRLRLDEDGKVAETTKVVEKASSFTIDYESTSTPFYLVQLSGK